MRRVSLRPGLPSPWRGLPVLLLVAVCLAMPAPGEAQTELRPEIHSLNFEGNESYGDRTLANSIVTRQTACRSFIVSPFCWIDREFAIDRAFLNPRVFAVDRVRVSQFYRVRGYHQVQVDTTIHRRTPTEVDLTFTIQEGEPIRIATFEVLGAGNVEGGTIDGNLPVGVGDRLDLIEIRAARDTLTRRLQNQGYAHAEVFRDQFIPDDTPLEAELAFDVFPGPRARFGPIEVVGNEQVSEAVIRRMLPFQEGFVYSREAIFEAQRQLYSLAIFRHASVVEELDHQPDSIVPLRVEVSEGDAHRVRSGLGWTTADCFTGESRWSARNFMGGARRLVLRGRLSGVLTSTFQESICQGAGTGEFARLNWLASAEFTQPWIFSPRNSFSAAIFAERQSVPDIYIRESLGLNLSLTRTVGRAMPVTLSYQPQLATLSAAEVFFCSTFLVCNPQEIDVLQSANVLAPIGLRASRDRTNRAVSPTGGYTASLDLEHAAAYTASDFDYERATGEITGFLGVRDAVLAGRLRGGWLSAAPFRGFEETERETARIAHPQKRFYAGGANSVRGYAQNQLGPRVVTLPVQDLIFPIGGAEEAVCDPLEVRNLTCDASPLAEGAFDSRPAGGSAVIEGSLELRFPIWDAIGGVAFVDFGQVWVEPSDVSFGSMVATPGIGFRYSTPIGPVRMDLAYRPRTSQDLPVITSSIRPWEEGVDPADRRIQGPDGERIPWVLEDELARLDSPFPVEDDPGFSFRRLQIQFSIGQAF
jgi:outer membrane protein assembly factor BamA